MKILVRNEEEEINLVRRLMTLCGTIWLSDINDVEKKSAEGILCILRYSICVEKPADNSEKERY